MEPEQQSFVKPFKDTVPFSMAKQIQMVFLFSFANLMMNLQRHEKHVQRDEKTNFQMSLPSCLICLRNFTSDKKSLFECIFTQIYTIAIDSYHDDD
ncbi:hypothetical protein T4B_2360 [Trichinella pseudospiralis]|uniref:Uncharacterized protein n=1 Tax=Trichinella pseudospiralis TaxID=6337 RepID=A0A0V1II79_TRIPS|nr:hypothetical protein T4B_2360 [Trichinella pseudospiralis]